MAKKPLFQLPEDAYTQGGVSILKVVTMKDAIKEYKRLRRIALRRLRTFKGTEYESSTLYQMRSKAGFVTVSQIKKDKNPAAALGSALSDVRGYLQSKESTYNKMRQVNIQRVKTLNEHGYDFVTMQNIQRFGEFMEAVRLKMGNKDFKGSPRVAEAYEAAVKKGIPPDEILKDFNYWMANVEELNKSRRKKGEGITAEDYKRTIENRKKRQQGKGKRGKKK